METKQITYAWLFVCPQCHKLVRMSGDFEPYEYLPTIKTEIEKLPQMET